MHLQILLIVVLAMSSCPRVVSGQVSSYSMIVNCPQGCRPVDKLVSCGGEEKTAACVMADNGDVMINCTNGRYYTLGVFGCGGDSAVDPNAKTDPGLFGPGVANYVAEHEVAAQTRVIELLQGVPPMTLAILLFVLAGVHGCLGFLHLRFLQLVPSMMLGLVFGYLTVSFFVPPQTFLHQWISLTTGIALGLLLVILAVLKKSTVRPMFGANLGLFLALVFLYVHAAKFPSFDLGGVTMPFFILLSSMIIFSAISACVPFVLGVFLFAVESATFVTWGYSVVTHRAKGDNPDPLTNGETVTEVLSLFLGSFVVVLGVQACLARRMILKIKQRKLRQQLMENSGGDDDPYLLAQRREAERKEARKREKRRGRSPRAGERDSSSPHSGNLLQDGQDSPNGRGHGNYGTSTGAATLD